MLSSCDDRSDGCMDDEDEMARCSVAILCQTIHYQFIYVACATNRACHVSSLCSVGAAPAYSILPSPGELSKKRAARVRVRAKTPGTCSYLAAKESVCCAKRSQKDVCCCKTFVVAPLSRSLFFVHISHAFLSLYRFKTCVTPRSWTGL